MRIGLVRARYTPFGGAERFAQRAIMALDAQGTRITVIARSWTDSVQNGMHADWIQCDPFYIGATWRDLSFARAVRACVRHGAFDLVQSHERIAGLDIYRAGDGVHAAWLERRAKSSGRWQSIATALNLHHHYLKWVERRMFEHPKLRAVICNSTMVRDEIQRRFRISSVKLHLIYNGVELQTFNRDSAATSRDALRASLAIADAAPVLLFVGSGFARKGLSVALEALASLDRRCHLVVAGHDKHAHHYRERAAELGLAATVHFVGPVADPLQWYGAADLFVLPSVYDPFPNAVLEALACGLPCLVSDGCGAQDVIEEGNNGWVVPVGDVGSWARAIATAVAAILPENGGERLRAASHASAQRFSVEALGQNLVAFYETLLAGSPAIQSANGKIAF